MMRAWRCSGERPSAGLACAAAWFWEDEVARTRRLGEGGTEEDVEDVVVSAGVDGIEGGGRKSQVREQIGQDIAEHLVRGSLLA
jgi:hypothetical protein